MRLKVVIFSVLLLLFAILAVLNTADAEVNLIFRSIQLPLIILIMVIFLIGLAIGLMVCSLYERKKKKEEAHNAAAKASGKTEETKKIEIEDKNKKN